MFKSRLNSNTGVIAGISMIVLAVALNVAFYGGIVWVAVHFIRKFW